MELIYLVSLMAFWCVLLVEAEDPYRFYTFNVTYGEASPLGTQQTVILINGQFPGPTIDCVTNDNIVVNVFNMLDEPFLLTWNGIKQRKNSWQDGVLGTNCPIPSKSNFTYKFQTKDQIGSYTYFPSIGMQRAVGGFGAFNVMARSVIAVPYYPKPDGNLSLLIGDWYTKSHQKLTQLLDYGKALPPPDAILINGARQFNISGLQGKTYMFRISNIGLSTSVNFRIQGHKLRLAEIEGSHVVPNMLHSIDVYVGQTVTVLVTLDQPPNAYYIVVSSTFTKNLNLNTTGILLYNSLTSKPVGPIPPAADGDVAWSMDQARSIRWNLTANGARPNAQGSYRYWNITRDRTFTLESRPRILNNTQRYTVNNISYVNPDTPLKLADHYKFTDVFNLTFPTNVKYGNITKLGTYVLNATHHEFVEIVFRNKEDVLQSWHLDGYDFFVVGMGTGEWAPASRNGPDAYNLKDAYTRHTVQVYPHSWTAILVSLDNVGMWNLRSAIWPRQYLGQQFYIRVVGEPSPQNEYGIPANAILCGKAKNHKLD